MAQGLGIRLIASVGARLRRPILPCGPDIGKRTTIRAVGLAAAVRRGCDLRVYTEFRYDEHVVPGSENTEMCEEMLTRLDALPRFGRSYGS